MHALHDRRGLSRELPGRGIERLRQKRVLPEVQQTAGGVQRAGECVDDAAVLLPVERGKVDAGLFALRVVVVRGEKEGLSVGQEHRPAVRRVARRIDLRDGDRRSARGRDAKDLLARVRCEQDHAVAVP